MNLNLAIDEKELVARIDHTLQFAVAQLEKMLPAWPVEKPAPIYTENSVWTRPSFIWTDWCPGFYAGMMWLALERTGDSKWRRAAESYTRKLEPRKFDRDVHDLGFIFMSTANRWHELLPDGDATKAWLRELLITAGTTQSLRWKDTGDDH